MQDNEQENQCWKDFKGMEQCEEWGWNMDCLRTK